MLVLSRKQGESIEFAELDVVVRVISLKKSKVQLGIEAPRHIRINRSELVREQGGSQAIGDSGPESDDGPDVLEELARVEAEVAALAELVETKDRAAAHEVAGNAIERLDRIKLSLGDTCRQRPGARPISEFIKVRADVIDQLKVSTRGVSEDGDPNRRSSDQWSESDFDKTSCVRERSRNYALGPPQAARQYSVA